VKKEKVLNKQRLRRKRSVRKGLSGSADRPRLTVFRSAQHISVQVIDDSSGKTLASASSLDKNLRDDVKSGGNKDAAAAVGQAIAERAIAAGVTAVKLDRGSSRYHGRVAALADAAREGGLDF
jgi:large subunit ribosomal protein L18